MRNIVATLLASTLAAGAFTAANAADAINDIPQAPVAYEQPAPIKNWAGAYVGGTVGYDWGKDSAGAKRDHKGFGGGLYGGYNVQDGQMVYGAEADVNLGDEKGSAGTIAGVGPAESKQGVNGSLRARVGYDTGPVLVYGTAGAALSKNKVYAGGDKDSATALGYTVGAGAETFITDNVTARLEYRYSDYQKKDFNVGGTTVSRGYDDHSVKAGIGVKF